MRTWVSNMWGRIQANKRASAVLAAIMLCALALRLWGINWGLPYLYHHDETIFVMISQDIFKKGDLNPHYFDYGSVFFYLNALAYVPYYLVGWVAGVFHTPTDIAYPSSLVIGEGYTPMQTTYLLGRGITLLFGMAAVYMMFLIGKRVANNTPVGLLAAFMAAISPTLIEHSRTITPNMFLVFFILLTVWGALRIYFENTTGAYLLAGVAAGLVVSTKYNGALVFGLVVLACLLRNGWAGLKERRLYMALGASILAFFITTPFAVFDYPAFSAAVIGQAVHYSTGHPGMEGDTVAWYTEFVWRQEGPVILVGIAGMIFAILARSKPLLIISAFPVVYGLFISTFVVRNDRTIMPIFPFLFILASVVLVQAGQWVIARGWNPRRAYAVGAVVILLLAIEPCGQTIATAMKITTIDSRATGVEWIKQNIPPGSKVAIEVGAPYIDPGWYDVQPIGTIILHEPDWYVDEKFDYLVFAQDMFGRYYREPDRYSWAIDKYEVFFKTFTQVKELTDGGYPVLIYRVDRKASGGVFP